MTFQCGICGDTHQNLYSVKLAIYDNSMDDEYVISRKLERLNSLPPEQSILLLEHERNQLSFKRNFICGFCFNHFVQWAKENNIGGVPTYINGKYWRLSANYSHDFISSGKLPPIYNEKKWKKYQEKSLNKLIL